MSFCKFNCVCKNYKKYDAETEKYDSSGNDFKTLERISSEVKRSEYDICDYLFLKHRISNIPKITETPNDIISETSSN